MKPSAQTKLNIFSDLSLIDQCQNPVSMLYPFLIKDKNKTNKTIPNQFNAYVNACDAFFTFSPIEKSDIAIFPIPWEQVVVDKSRFEAFEIFYDNAQDYAVPVVIFFLSDSDRPISIKNTIIFRTSLNRSTKKNNEFALPAWEENIVENYFSGEIQLRKKETRPSLGFTGYAPERSYIRDIYNWVEVFLGFKPPNKGSFSNVRSEAMKVLLKSDLINNHFLLRDVFWGTQADAQKRKKEKEEFIENMINNDYILCARGGGNFSYRFYETLSCGRIPLFINTDCVLPYDFEINYKNYCVWIEDYELSRADKILLKFHDTISEEDFLSLQYNCRRIWQHYLSPEGFFANFYKHFPFSKDNEGSIP